MAEELTKAEAEHFDTGGEKPIPAEKTGAETIQIERGAEEGAEGAEGTEGGQQRQRMVPHEALHEARERYKAEKARNDKLEERFNKILDSFQKPAEPVKPAAAAVAIPELAKDPVGHFKALHEASEARLKAIQERLDGREKQEATAREQQTNLQALVNRANAEETAHRARTPDYQSAVDYLKEGRARELTALGVPAEQHGQIIAQDALAIADAAIRAGKNVGAFIYDLAKARGYIPKQAEAAGAEAERQIATAARGQRQATTIGTAAGKGAGKVSLADLADMSDADFEKATKDGKWREMWGRA